MYIDLAVPRGNFDRLDEAMTSIASNWILIGKLQALVAAYCRKPSAERRRAVEQAQQELSDETLSAKQLAQLKELDLQLV